MHTTEAARTQEDTDQLAEEIALLWSQIDATTHRLLTAIRGSTKPKDGETKAH